MKDYLLVLIFLAVLLINIVNMESGIPMGTCGRSVKSIEDAIRHNSTIDSRLQSQPWLVEITNDKKLICIGVLIQLPSRIFPHSPSVELNRKMKRVFNLIGNEAAKFGTGFFITPKQCLEDVSDMVESLTILVGSKKIPNEIMNWRAINPGNTVTEASGVVVTMLKNWVEFNDAAQPICLTKYDPERKVEEKAVLVKIKEGKNDRKSLDISRVDVTSAWSICGRIYPNFKPYSLFCTPNITTGIGSPLIHYKHGTGQAAFLYGLVSWEKNERKKEEKYKYYHWEAIATPQYKDLSPGIIYTRIPPQIGIERKIIELLGIAIEMKKSVSAFELELAKSNVVNTRNLWFWLFNWF